MKIVFVTDLHGAMRSVERLVDLPDRSDLLLVGGDVTNFGGVEVARKVLAPLRAHFPRVLCVNGNVDQPEILPWLVDEGLSVHGAGVDVGGAFVIGLGGSNRTPMRTPSEYSEEAMADLLRQGHESRAPTVGDLPIIVVTHTPPRHTRADRLWLGTHVGSTAVRAFVEEHEPALCLCGHVHESRTLDVLGPTTICNPGAFSQGGYATIEVSAPGFVACKMHRLDLTRRERWSAEGRMMADKVIGLVRQRIGKRR